MTKYDMRKKRHLACKDKMSSSDWKRSIVMGKVCPICGKY